MAAVAASTPSSGASASVVAPTASALKASRGPTAARATTTSISDQPLGERLVAAAAPRAHHTRHQPTLTLDNGFQRIQLIGRLARDPELRSTQSRGSICELRLPRRSHGGGEDRGAVFVDGTTFGALAENCGEYLSQGRRVAVSGRLELDEWKHDGETRRRHKVVADEIDFLDAAKRDEAAPAA
jgi:single-strand DNA-binding protein